MEEYKRGGVESEAGLCIRDLRILVFIREVVKKALVMSKEKKNDGMMDLLQDCFNEGLININQMTKGFTRIKDGIDDLVLDVTNVKEKFSFFVEHAQNKGWLLVSFAFEIGKTLNGKLVIFIFDPGGDNIVVSWLLNLRGSKVVFSSKHFVAAKLDQTLKGFCSLMTLSIALFWKPAILESYLCQLQ